MDHIRQFCKKILIRCRKKLIFRRKSGIFHTEPGKILIPEKQTDRFRRGVFPQCRQTFQHRQDPQFFHGDPCGVVNIQSRAGILFPETGKRFFKIRKNGRIRNGGTSLLCIKDPVIPGKYHCQFSGGGGIVHRMKMMMCFPDGERIIFPHPRNDLAPFVKKMFFGLQRFRIGRGNENIDLDLCLSQHIFQPPDQYRRQVRSGDQNQFFVFAEDGNIIHCRYDLCRRIRQIVFLQLTEKLFFQLIQRIPASVFLLQKCAGI